MAEFRILTDRLILREWRTDDAVAVRAIGRDERVMAHMGPLMTEQDAQALVAGQMVNQRLFGHCFWAAECRSDGAIVGVCGLNPGPADTPLAGALEIAGWLAFEAWGKSYACEAASACLDWAWRQPGVAVVAAMTARANDRSQRLMARLGMSRATGDDYDLPSLGASDPLRRQIVYRIARPDR